MLGFIGLTFKDKLTIDNLDDERLTNSNKLQAKPMVFVHELRFEQGVAVGAAELLSILLNAVTSNPESYESNIKDDL